MRVIPGDAAIISPKRLIRQHILPQGWEAPAENILAVYFSECERLQVSATTGCVSELQRRKCSMQPLPFHVLHGLSRAEQIARVLRHHDWERTGALSVASLERLIRVVAPLYEAADFEQIPELRGPPSRTIPLQDCEAALARVVASLKPAIAEHGLLEIFVLLPVLPSLSRAAKFRAAFWSLDIDMSGSLDIGELRALAAKVAVGANIASEDDASKLLREMDDNKDNCVSEDEFVTHLLQASDGASDIMIDKQITTMLSERAAGRFHYDFSHSFCGNRGALPIIAALRLDRTCESVDLSGCGLHSETIAELASVASTHPSLKAIYVHNNPISTEGARALLAMLAANPEIVVLQCEGAHFSRGFSPVHHDSVGPLAPGPEELAAALKANQDSKTSCGSVVAVAKLREHVNELRSTFVNVMDAREETACLSDLVQAVSEEARAWGVSEADVRSVLHPERLFTGAVEDKALLDEAGAVRVTRGEFLNAFSPEAAVKLVTANLKYHMVDIKASFYRMAVKHGFAVSSDVMTCYEDGAPEQLCSPVIHSRATSPPGHDAARGAEPAESLLQGLAAVDDVRPGEEEPAEPRPNESHETEPLESAATVASLASACETEVAPSGAACESTEEEVVNLALSIASGGDLIVGLSTRRLGAVTSPPAVASSPHFKVPLWRVNEMLREQIQDPAQGYGILYSDYEAVIPSRCFAEYAGMSADDFDGWVTWPLFIGTILHLLNR